MVVRVADPTRLTIWFESQTQQLVTRARHMHMHAPNPREEWRKRDYGVALSRGEGAFSSPARAPVSFYECMCSIENERKG